MCTKYKTICVVDDEPSICKALKRLLMAAGFNVTTYNSGQQFLDESKETEPDLMVLDMQMPNMTGLDLQKHLLTTGRVIPTIFISANGNDKTKNAAMAAGAVTFFQKPVEESDLLSAIHKSLGIGTQ